MIGDEALAAEWVIHSRHGAHPRHVRRPARSVLFARAAPTEAVGERLVRVLLGLPEIWPGAGARKGSIAVCFEPMTHRPLPAGAGSVGHRDSSGERGGKTSHAALVARDLGIPYVAGIKNLGPTGPARRHADRRRLARRVGLGAGRRDARSLPVEHGSRPPAFAGADVLARSGRRSRSTRCASTWRPTSNRSSIGAARARRGAESDRPHAHGISLPLIAPTCRAKRSNTRTPSRPPAPPRASP